MYSFDDRENREEKQGDGQPNTYTYKHAITIE